jgi:hypothetical protein
MHTLIAPDDTFAILAILLLAAALGIAGERRRWFGKVSGVIVTIAATAALTTASVIPSASNPDISVPVYDLVFTYVVPLANMRGCGRIMGIRAGGVVPSLLHYLLSVTFSVGGRNRAELAAGILPGLYSPKGPTAWPPWPCR